MKKIFKVFLSDIKKIFSRPFAAIVMVGILILPSLYAWVNIYACWDPYGNTKNLKVAVANVDKGADILGVNVSIGSKVIDNLTKNDVINWQFTDKDAALQGVEDGTYYAAVIIPEDFTKDMTSILKKDITKPKIDYYVNQKKNAIAPKITDKVASSIQQQIDETFISTVASTLSNIAIDTQDDVDGDVIDIVNNLKDTVQMVEKDLDNLKNDVKTFKSLTTTLSSLVDTAREAVPKDAFSNASKLASDTADTAKAANNFVNDISGSLDTIVSMAESDMLQISNDFSSAIAAADTANNTVADRVDLVYNKCATLNSYCSDILAVVQTLEGYFPDLQGLKQMDSKLTEAISDLSLLQSELYDAASSLRSAGTLAAEKQASIENRISTLRGLFSDIKSDYRVQVSPKIDTLTDSLYDNLNSLSSFLTTMGGVDWDKTLNSMDKSLTSAADTFDGLTVTLDTAQTKIKSLLKNIEDALDSEEIDAIKSLITRDPDETAAFLSSPVDLQTNSVYAIENYGSAMTPFYTVLCLWVGSVILIAMLKVQIIDAEERKLRMTQCYFGRYLLFFAAGVVQAVIACLGDLYVLGIQCPHPAAFVFAGAYTAFVFTLFVYTLVVSFAEIGKAIAVVFLVIQIAGAGGTFPIETTPQFFQALNPLLPFTGAINAMREAIGGMHGCDYWLYLLQLSAYIPIALIIGLVLRKPLILLNHKLEGRLHETGIM